MRWFEYTGINLVWSPNGWITIIWWSSPSKSNSLLINFSLVNELLKILQNIKDSVEKQIAVNVDFTSLTFESFESGLREVLENRKYIDNIKLISKRFRDRPIKPLNEAVWWVEYILRNPKPNHLKPKTLEMNFFTANSLDFLLLVSTTTHVLLVIFVGLIWMSCCSNSKTRKSAKKLKTKWSLEWICCQKYLIVGVRLFLI